MPHYFYCKKASIEGDHENGGRKQKPAHTAALATRRPPPRWVPTPTQLPWEEAPRAGAPSRARWLGALRGVVQVPVAFSLLQKLLCSVGSHHGKHLNQRANVASNPGHSLGFLHSISLQD